MRKKILIINRCLSDNLGDQAIGRAVKKLFTDRGFDVEITDLISVKDKRILNLCNINNETNKSKKLNFIKKIKVLNIIHWYLSNYSMFNIIKNNKFDLVIIGGGELVQSNLLFPIALYIWTKKIKKSNCNIPIVLFSVGVTSKYVWYNKFFVERALNNCDYVYVRDPKSLENLKSIFNISASEMPDSVFSMELNKYSQVKDQVLFGITSFERIVKHKQNFKTEIEYFESKYNEIKKFNSDNIILIYSNIVDYKSCIKFKKFVLEKYNINLRIGEYRTLDEFIELINESSLIISNRMHALILGLVLNKTIECDCISLKVEEFKQKYLNERIELKHLSQQVNNAVDEIVEKFKLK